MSIQWWRSWHGAPIDHKWAVIAARAKVKTGIVSAIAWALMDYASQADDRGSIEGFDIETYSVYSGFEIAEIEAVIDAMRSKDIINGDQFTSWEKRQPAREDPTNAERQSRYKAKQKVTQDNAEKREKTPKIKIKIKDKDKEKEEEGEIYFLQNTFNDSLSEITQFTRDEFVENSKLSTLYTNVTGNLGWPADSKKVEFIMNSLRSIQDIHQADAKAYLKTFFDEWIKRKYNRMNPAWLEWALAGEIPKVRKQSAGGSALTNRPTEEEAESMYESIYGRQS